MKTKLILLLLLLVVVFSCTKTKINTVTTTINDTTTVTTIDTPFQTPIKTIVAQGILVDTIRTVPATGTEIGSEFYTSDTGTVSQLGGLFIAKNVAFTVTLWDVATESILAQANVTTTDTTKFAYTTITPIHLSANKLYMISYNDGIYNTLLPTLKGASPSTLALPYSVGNVTFVGSFYINSVAFPSTQQNEFITPADFVFKVNN